MKIEEIKELIQALEQSSLTALELCQGNDRIRLERNFAATTAVPAAPALQAAPIVVPVQSVVETAQPEPKAEAPQSKGTPVTCPLVGVFYPAPSPDDAPFVTVGSQVKKGDVLCLVEAMKLMNEIIAERDGVISEICAENGQVVEFGQPLFYMA